MKKALLSLMLLPCAAFAQNTFSSVEVTGTLKTINGPATWDHLKIWSAGANSFIESNGDEDGLVLRSVTGNKVMVMSNLGVGMMNPTQRLEVNGNAQVNEGKFISSITSPDVGGTLELVNPAKSAAGVARNWVMMNMTGSYGNSLQFWAYDQNGCSGGLCANRFTIADNGNVGIGVMIPNDKLSVNGQIRAREIKVETQNWPDFVFSNDYKLMSLKQLNNYIRVNKHLPGIPSAAEVEKEGLALGEMNKKLLQKVEELTLHLINSEQRADDAEKRVEELQRRQEKIERMLDALQKTK